MEVVRLWGRKPKSMQTGFGKALGGTRQSSGSCINRQACSVRLNLHVKVAGLYCGPAAAPSAEAQVWSIRFLSERCNMTQLPSFQAFPRRAMAAAVAAAVGDMPTGPPLTPVAPPALASSSSEGDRDARRYLRGVGMRPGPSEGQTKTEFRELHTCRKKKSTSLGSLRREVGSFSGRSARSTASAPTAASSHTRARPGTRTPIPAGTPCGVRRLEMPLKSGPKSAST